MAFAAEGLVKKPWPALKVLGQETLTKTPRCGLVWSRNLDKNAFTAETAKYKQGLLVRKKTLLAAAFISALLISAVAGTQLANLGKAGQQ